MGAMFHDTNGNGYYDAGDTLLVDWHIRLDAQPAVTLSEDEAPGLSYVVCTSSQPGRLGLWSLPRNMEPGVYRVRLVPKLAWRIVYPDTNDYTYLIDYEAPTRWTLLSDRPTNYSGLNFGAVPDNCMSGSALLDAEDTQISSWARNVNFGGSETIQIRSPLRDKLLLDLTRQVSSRRWRTWIVSA